MALIKCHECGAEISSDATSCPKCGAKPKYQVGPGIVVFAVLLTIFGLFAINSESTTKAPQKTESEIASDWRHQMGAAAVIRLKQNLRDPESLEILNIFADEKATTLCLKYRARNGFGGFTVEYQIITESKTSQDVDDWNRYCTNAMYDITAVKHML
jgi:hypothetical protein